MDITPTRDTYNLVLKRREVTFYIEHSASSTPRLYDLRKQVAARYVADEELVFIRSLRTLTGTSRAIGEAEVYDHLEDVKLLVPEHIIARNQLERHKTKDGSPPPKKEVKPKKG